jgi:exocyst complex protein 7
VSPLFVKSNTRTLGWTMQHAGNDTNTTSNIVVDEIQFWKCSLLQETSLTEQDRQSLQQIWAEDSFNVKQFSEALHSVDRGTHHTVEVLVSLEQRLSQLLDSFKSIQQKTSKWLNVYTNIESSMEALNCLLDTLDAAVVTRNVILADIPHQREGLDQYLAHVTRIESALKTLRAHTKWKSATSTQQSLETLRTHALRNLHDFFETLLHKYSFPNEEQLPPSQVLFDLQKVAAFLARANVSSWVATYTTRRTRWLLEGVQRTLEPDITLVTLPYARGSHHFIHSLHTLLRRLTVERQLCASLFSDIKQYRDVYRCVITPALDKWSEAGDILLDHLRHQHRQGQAVISLSILCDIWGCLYALLPHFEQVLSYEREGPQKSKHGNNTNDFDATVKSTAITNTDKVDNTNKNISHELIRSSPNSQPPLLVTHITEFWASLTSVARQCFSEFRTQIQRDPLDRLASDGTVSALTTSTLNVLQMLLTYSDCVSSHLLPPLPTIKGKSTLTVYVLRALSDLIENLEAKAKKEKKSSLAHIFLLNNFFFIWKTVKNSNLLSEVGEATLREYQALYEREKTAYMKCWHKTLSYLSEVTDQESRNSVPKEVTPVNSSAIINTNVKQRFQGFNSEFTELSAAHTRYLIADDELRQEMRRDLINLILPRYQLFFNKYADVSFSKNKEKYIRYTPAMIEQMLCRFFEGNG